MSSKVRRSGPRNPSKGSLPFLLHALVYPEGGDWLAHCLEFDTVAQGETPEEARKGLLNALDLLIADATEHADIRGLFRPAPSALWRKYAESTRRRRFQKASRRDLSLDARLIPA